MSSIVIAAYSSDWPLHFARERAGLLTVFSGMAAQVQHIGSTSVPGLAAKPVIDILLGAESLVAIESRIAALAQCGYRYIAKYEQDLPMRRYCFKPEAHGVLRVNLHAVVSGSLFWREHIAFRDALRADAVLLADYCSLKKALAARFPQDTPSYTDAKAPFIRAVIDARR